MRQEAIQARRIFHTTSTDKAVAHRELHLQKRTRRCIRLPVSKPRGTRLSSKQTPRATHHAASSQYHTPHHTSSHSVIMTASTFYPPHLLTPPSQDQPACQKKHTNKYMYTTTSPSSPFPSRRVINNIKKKYTYIPRQGAKKNKCRTNQSTRNASKEKKTQEWQ